MQKELKGFNHSMDSQDFKDGKPKIVCEVKNCIHHAGECECNAGTVAVGPLYAASSSDTVCATFKPKRL